MTNISNCTIKFEQKRNILIKWLNKIRLQKKMYYFALKINLHYFIESTGDNLIKLNS